MLHLNADFNVFELDLVDASDPVNYHHPVILKLPRALEHLLHFG